MTDKFDAREIVEHRSERLTLTMPRAYWLALHRHLEDNGNFFEPHIMIVLASVKGLLRTDKPDTKAVVRP